MTKNNNNENPQQMRKLFAAWQRAAATAAWQAKHPVAVTQLLPAVAATAAAAFVAAAIQLNSFVSIYNK